MKRLFACMAAACVAILFGLSFVSAAEPVVTPSASHARYFDIPSGALGTALMRFGELAGMRLLVSSEITAGRSTRGISGDFTPQQALSELLDGTGLIWRLNGSDTVILERVPETEAALLLSPVRVQGRYENEAALVYDTPGSVAVVTREQIDRLPPRNTADVLAGIPGVMTSNDRQNPGVRINIRGLEGMGRVNATIDGARQNYQQSGHTGGSSVYLDPELLSGVDVKLGPSSGVGGAGVIGGTVNFRTLTADDILRDEQDYGARLNAMTGTNRYHFAGSLAAALRTTETTDVVAAYSVKDIGEYDTGERNRRTSGSGISRLSFSDQQQQSGLFKARWNPSANHALQLGYVGFRADYTDNAVRTDGSMDDETAFFRNLNSISVDTVTLRHNWLPGGHWWDLDSSLWYTRTTNDQIRNRGGTGSSGNFDIHYETNTAGGSLDNTADLGQWRGFDARLNFGTEFFGDWTRPEASTEDGGDPYWFTGATPKGERQVGSAFAELTLMREEWLEIIAGLRYDAYRLTGEGIVYVGRFANGQEAFRPFDVERKKGALAPKLTISLFPLESIRMYLSYGEGLRPPHTTEILMSGSHPFIVAFPYIPNPNLKEETNRSWEAGIIFQQDGLLLEHDSLKTKLSAFHNDIDNYIITAAVLLPTDIRAENLQLSMVNIENPVRFYGAEFQSDYDAGRFFANANLTLTKRDLGGGNYDPFPLGTVVVNPDPAGFGTGSGLDLSTIPPELRYSFSAGLRFFDGRMETGLRMQFVGKRESRINNDGSSNMFNMMNAHDWGQDGYRIYDAWASWQLHARVKLRLSVQNLTDEAYKEALSSTSNHLAPGRTFLASVSMTF